MTNHLRKTSDVLFEEVQERIENAETARKELEYILIDWKRTKKVPESRMRTFYESR